MCNGKRRCRFHAIATGKEIDEELLGRKLLVFSDSRQEAAFFASYLQSKYSNILWRNAIIHQLGNLQEYDDI